MDWEQFTDEIAAQLQLFGDTRITFRETFPSRDKRLPQKDVSKTLDISIDALKKRYKNNIFPAFAEIEGLTLPNGKGQLKTIHQWLCKEFQTRQPRSHQNREQSRPVVAKATLSNLLADLDYTNQSMEYENLRRSFSPTVAFLVRAECQYVQKWLVKRLSQRLNSYGLRDNFQLFPIDAGIADIRYCGIDSLWSLFEFGATIPKSQSDVVSILTDLYAQNKTILIVLYRLNSIEDPATVKGILRFWKEVSDFFQTRHIPGSGEYSKLVLLLSDNSLEKCPIRTKYKLDKPLRDLIPDIDALSRFPDEDIRDFLLKPEFRQPIQEKYGPEKYREICNDKRRWQQTPQEILDSLCSYSNIAGFAEYKEAWDLTYEV